LRSDFDESIFRRFRLLSACIGLTNSKTSRHSPKTFHVPLPNASLFYSSSYRSLSDTKRVSRHVRSSQNVEIVRLLNLRHWRKRKRRLKTLSLANLGAGATPAKAQSGKDPMCHCPRRDRQSIAEIGAEHLGCPARIATYEVAVGDDHRDYAKVRVTFRRCKSVSVLIASSELNTQPACTPVYASPCTSRYPTQNWEAERLATPSRTTLPFPASCRFSPARHIGDFSRIKICDRLRIQRDHMTRFAGRRAQLSDGSPAAFNPSSQDIGECIGDLGLNGQSANFNSTYGPRPYYSSSRVRSSNCFSSLHHSSVRMPLREMRHECSCTSYHRDCG
jgi:hypothetical protein